MSGLNDIDSQLPVRGDGDYDAALNECPNSTGLIGHDRAGTGATPDETAQNKRITAVIYDDGSSETIVALDVAIRDENGIPYSASNPLPTSIEESEGDEIHEHDESGAVAKAGVDNHDYVVSVGKKLLISSWKISGSGYMRGTLQIEDGVGVGTFTDADVLLNSVANPNAREDYKRDLVVAAGVIVRIERVNLDKQSQGMYSLLKGLEVDA